MEILIADQYTFATSKKADKGWKEAGVKRNEVFGNWRPTH